jgi:amino acid adenylation domain-containing protein
MGLELPLSAAQLGVWYALKAGTPAPAYNIGEYVKICADIDPAEFEAALRHVVSETESLCVRFVERGGDPKQLPGTPPDWNMSYVDVSDQAHPVAVAEAWMHADMARPVDLCDGPFFAFALFKSAPQEFLWYVRYHHLVVDAFAGLLIARRVAEVYSSVAAGLTVERKTFGSLPALVAEDAAYRASGHFNSDRQYWLDLLADCPEPPSLGLRTSPASEQLLHQIVDLPAATVARLRQVAERLELTFPQLVTLAVAIFIHRLTEAEDIVLGQLMTARMSPTARQTPAMVTNVVPLRVAIKPDMPVEELAVQVRRGVRSGMRHQRYRIADMRRDLRRIDRPIVRQSVSVRPFDYASKFAGAQGTIRTISSGPAEDLNVHVVYDQSENGAWCIEFDANPALYDREFLTLLQNRFLRLLDGMHDPAASVGSLDILPAEERQQILVDWNETRADYPRDRQAQELFEEQARRTPDRIAAVFERQHLTYRELDQKADHLARHLVQLGVGPNDRVALHVERSLDMLVSVLGILKSGGAYVPLDPNYPQDRLDFILQDCQPLVLLTQRSLQDRLHAPNADILYIDELPTLPAGASQTPPAARQQAGDLAYVLYTSGSTGRPKGVQIPHRALVNFLKSMQLEPGIGPEDSLLSVTSLSFDIAGLELLLPLVTGARVTIASGEVAADAISLANLIQDCGATIMQATPATWRLLLEAGWYGSQKLKILCGGEAWSTELAANLLPRCASLWNMYGPTETTVWSAVAKIEKDQAILIGPPIANTKLYVLDRNRQPVPIGVAGELHIGGDGVARGYLNRPELTRERFHSDPFSLDPAARLYQTGDRVRHLPDGKLEFLGRFDHQVKIRGFRIELGEIEAVLRQHPEVQDAVVMARDDGAGDKRLVAYVTPNGSAPVAVAGMRDFLRRKLAPYMVPSAFVPLDAFPLTPNGKVDRNALPLPGDQSRQAGRARVAPRTPLEQRLAEFWCQSLQLSEVGIHDNFFDLGGDSLAMLRLSLDIEQATGQNCPLPWIFEAPTVAEMAAMLGRGDSQSGYTPLVLLRPGDDDAPPLFMVHPVNGSTVQLIPMAKTFSGRNPVYGIQAKGLDGSETPLSRIDEMADCYLRAITEVQPHGPYLLSGMCFGGLIALEIARRLTERGESIGVLALLDSYPHPRYWPLRFRMNYLVMRRINEVCGKFKGLNGRETIAYVAKLFSKVLRKSAAAVSGGQPYLQAPDTLPPSIKAVFDSCSLAANDYRPQYYHGKVSYLMCGFHAYLPDGPKAVWSRLVGQLDVHNAPVLMPPEYVGGWLFDRLQEATAENATARDGGKELERHNLAQRPDALIRT